MAIINIYISFLKKGVFTIYIYDPRGHEKTSDQIKTGLEERHRSDKPLLHQQHPPESNKPHNKPS